VDKNKRVKTSLSTPRRRIEGVELWFHLLVTLVLGGGEWSISLSGRFAPGNQYRYPLSKEIWVGPRFGPDVLLKRKLSWPRPRIITVVWFTTVKCVGVCLLLLFVFLALQPIVVVFHSPVAGFSLLVFDVS
jgi:hypothetical protein